MEVEDMTYNRTNLARFVQTPGTKDARPLQHALNEHGEQLDKLGALLSNLEDRLHPIRNSSPSAEDSAGVSERAGSEVLNQVSAQSTNVRRMQHQISSLLEELEI